MNKIVRCLLTKGGFGQVSTGKVRLCRVGYHDGSTFFCFVLLHYFKIKTKTLQPCETEAGDLRGGKGHDVI